MGLLLEDGRTNSPVLVWSDREEPPPTPGTTVGSQEPTPDCSSQDEDGSCRQACDKVRSLVILGPISAQEPPPSSIGTQV